LPGSGTDPQRGAKADERLRAALYLSGNGTDPRSSVKTDERPQGELLPKGSRIFQDVIGEEDLLAEDFSTERFSGRSGPQSGTTASSGRGRSSSRFKLSTSRSSGVETANYKRISVSSRRKQRRQGSTEGSLFSPLPSAASPVFQDADALLFVTPAADLQKTGFQGSCESEDRRSSSPSPAHSVESAGGATGLKKEPGVLQSTFQTEAGNGSTSALPNPPSDDLREESVTSRDQSVVISEQDVVPPPQHDVVAPVSMAPGRSRPRPSCYQAKQKLWVASEEPDCSMPDGSRDIENDKRAQSPGMLSSSQQHRHKLRSPLPSAEHDGLSIYDELSEHALSPLKPPGPAPSRSQIGRSFRRGVQRVQVSAL